MSIAATMIVTFFYHLLGVAEIAMLARAILSWIIPDAEGLIIDLLYAVTEPFIAVIRRILSRFSALNASPLDISFMITAILIAILRLFLAAALAR